MPNTPAQFPNFDLPGAEWFSLAPNANIAIQGRRRASLTTQDDGYGFVQASVPLETNFIPGAAVFIHHASLMLQPIGLDTNLQVLTTLLALNASSTSTATWLPLGFPLATGVTLGFPTVAVSGSDVLVTQRDLAAIGASGLNSINPGSEPSAYVLNLAFKTRLVATSPQGYYAQASIVYTRLDGLTE